MSRWVMDGPTLHAISRALVYEAEPMGSIKETLKSIDERTSSKCRRQSGARLESARRTGGGAGASFPSTAV